MAFFKRPFVLEPKENFLLTAVCEENAVQDIEKDPIRVGSGAIRELSVYKLIKNVTKE